MARSRADPYWAFIRFWSLSLMKDAKPYRCLVCGSEGFAFEGRFFVSTGLCNACDRAARPILPEGPMKRKGGLMESFPDGPKEIGCLALNHPHRVVATRSQAARVLEENQLLTHPAQEGGVKSPCGVAWERPRGSGIPREMAEALKRFRERKS